MKTGFELALRQAGYKRIFGVSGVSDICRDSAAKVEVFDLPIPIFEDGSRPVIRVSCPYNEIYLVQSNGTYRAAKGLALVIGGLEARVVYTPENLRTV